MAGYGYAANGYTTYDNNMEPPYHGQGYACNDHVHRPAISYNRPGYAPKRDSTTYVDRVPEYRFNEYEGGPQEYQLITNVNQTEATHYPTKHNHAWQKSSPAPTYTWTKPKKSHQSTTTTTGLAADFVGRAITEAAPPSMQPFVQKVETYAVETIDNREATKRYARPVFKQSAQETYSGY